METVTRFADHKATAVVTPPATPVEVSATRTLTATATYVLSEDGRKAALLEGRDGRAVQTLTLQVAANRLHLVSVDREGVARLRLRPRFEMDGDQRVQRIDSAPVYDAPPTADELYRAAARNHELEAAYHAARQSTAEKRVEAERDVRRQAAEAFMNDKVARGLAHPPPTPKACYLATPQGRLRFDVRTDLGLAKEVPAEAFRRFRADLRAREERNRADRAAQLALHEDKKRFIAEWIADHGTHEQRERHAAGMLPMAEAVEAIADQAFGALRDYPLYVHDGVERMQQVLSLDPRHAGVTVTAKDLRIDSEHAQMATAEQFAMVRDVQRKLPNAEVVLRRHKISMPACKDVVPLVCFGVLVQVSVGPLMVRRELAAPAP